MSSIPQLVHDGFLAVGGASILYVITIHIAALTAIFSPRASLRRSARDVLAVLLRRSGLD
jgi:DNA-binding IclR family transcriptional regulator